MEVTTKVKWMEERIALVQAGETHEYAYVVEAYQRQIYVYCCRLLGNEQEAEDAVQDILVKAYESIKQYKPTVNFSSWIYKIAYHYCLNVLRRRQLQLKVQWLFKLDTAAESPEQTFDKQAFSEPLATALSALSPEERSLLILRVFEEKTFAELGDISGKSPDAVKKKIGRIKEKVRKVMKKGEEEERWKEHSILLKTRL
jgi:RNA polymerase sigma-70 factor (ECF subfamily)